MCKAGPSSFPQNFSFELGEDRQQAGHCSPRRCRQIQRFGQGNETHSEMVQFLKRRQQIRNRAAPAIQAPHQHHIDLPATGGFQQPFAPFSLRRSRVHLAHWQGDCPAAAGRILPQGAVLHRQRLLVIRRNARIQPRTKHFRRLPCMAKNVSEFCLLRSPFSGHFSASPNHGRSRSFSASQESFYYAAAASRARVSR